MTSAGYMALVGRKKGWTNPYVTDGLIAMWDGEWNAGGGMHISGSHNLVDCVAGGVITIADTNEVTIRDNYIQRKCDSTQNIVVSYPEYDLTGSEYVTIECVFRFLQRNIASSYFTIAGGCYGCSIGNSSTKECDFSVSFGTKNDWRYKQGVIVENNIQKLTLVAQRTSSPIIKLYDGTSQLYGFSYGYQGTATIYAKLTPFILIPQVANSCVCQLFSYKCYRKELKTDEIAANYSVDKERFNLP